MSGHLGVDADGLRLGASRSDAVAAALAAGAAGGVTGSQPSHAGVAAIVGAAQGVRVRQSGRVGRQAGDMRSGASSYEGTDTHTATDIARAM